MIVTGLPWSTRGFDETTTISVTFGLPTTIDTCPAPPQPDEEVDTGVAEAEGVALGDAPGAVVPGVAVAGPPETAVIHAVPERESDTKVARATPSPVLAWSSMWPRFVKNWTTVPSETICPSGRVTNAVTREDPPFVGTNIGFALVEIDEPAGAVKGTHLQVDRPTPRANGTAARRNVPKPFN
jgi:hypothetical protein